MLRKSVAVAWLNRSPSKAEMSSGNIAKWPAHITAVAAAMKTIGSERRFRLSSASSEPKRATTIIDTIATPSV